jgi:uncharacterized protein YbcI
LPNRVAACNFARPGRCPHYTEWGQPVQPIAANIPCCYHPDRGETVEVTVKTQGEIEAAICERLTRFEQEHMGREPKTVRAHLVGDLLLVRLTGVLTAAEERLVKSLPAGKGRDLLKEVRTHLIETARPILEEIVEEVTGVKVVSLHRDISTVTGEKVILFTLAAAPRVRGKQE